MKKLILALSLAAFTVMVQAGDNKKPDNDGGGGRDMKQGLMAHYFKDPTEWDGNWKQGAKPTVQAKDWTFREYKYSRKEPLINHCFVKRGWFSIRWTGYFKIPPAVTDKHGDAVEVSFDFWADDGARLFIDGKQLIDDWRPCAEDEPGSHRKGTVKLDSGYHRIVVEYFQGESLQKNDNDPAKLYWDIPSLKIKHQIIPASHFFHTDEDEADITPSQGLSAGDQQRLAEGDIPKVQND